MGVKLLNQSNPAAETDLIIALDLGRVGLNGCVNNIRANLSMIKDEEILRGFENHIQILLDQ